MGLSFSIRKQLLASTILVAAGSIYGGLSQEASAGSCATGDIPPALLNVSCTGIANAADFTQSFNSVGGVTITDIATFGLDTTTTGGAGITTSGGITNITITGTINALTQGISSNVTTASATTTITNSGSITSTVTQGIFVSTDADTSDVEITNNSGALIQAELDGIAASVQGASATTTITNSGSITSDDEAGIFVSTDADTSNVEITNNSGAIIQAQQEGINANVEGSSATTTISNSGSIISDTNDGIIVSTDADTGNVTITNNSGATIQANFDGIDANVEGAGALTKITNSGTITSNASDGIEVETKDTTGNVEITNNSGATILASFDGIRAVVKGSSATTKITNSGSITSNGVQGIEVDTDGDTGNVEITNNSGATIQADDQGILAFVDGMGATTTITNSGSITSNADRGISVATDGDTGNVEITNNSGAMIQADDQGILAFVDGAGATTTITNSGSITTNVSRGISLFTGAATGDVEITNNSGAMIQADDEGINATVQGSSATTTITNSGSIISDDRDGIRLFTGAATGDVEISNNSGAIIQVENDGINANVKGASALTKITNSGSITSNADRGISVATDGDTGNVEITNNSGATIQADNEAVKADVKGAGATTKITNSGTIISTGGFVSSGIQVATDGDTGNVEITNNSGAFIQALFQGIDADVTGAGALTKITNSGSITSNADRGILLTTDGDTSTVNVSHLATGDITSSDDGIHVRVKSTNQSVTIQALGKITSSTRNGITFSGNRTAQTNSVKIDVDHTVTATAAAGVNISETFANSANTITINAESNADIKAMNGIEIDAGNGTEIAINIKSGAAVEGSTSGIVDGSTAGLGAKTTVLLEGKLTGDVYLGGNDDSFTMKDADARLAPGTAAIVDGGAGIDDFTFDNVQRLFRHNLDNFEMVELKNNSFVTTRNKTFDTDEYLINPDNTHRGLGLTVIEGNVTNNGTISLADNSVNESYVMTGNLSGNGLYILDARLDATENADLVGVNGNIDPTSRNILRVNDLAGTGAATGNNDTDGILLVGVNGTSIADNFALENGPITAGAFVYDLHHSLGDDFFLQTTGISTMGASAASAAQGSVLGADALMAGYLTRKSGRLEAPLSGGQVDSDGNSFGADLIHASEVNPANVYWLRLLGAFGDYDGRVHSGGVADILNTDADFGGAQFGIDFAMTDYPYMVASISGHYLYQDNDIFNTTQGLPVGSTTLHSYGAGLEISYDPGAGMYFDALGAFSLTDVDVNAGPNLSGDTRGNEYFLSAEIGYRYQTGYGNLSFTPEAQIYSHLGEFSDFSFSNGVPVSDVSNERTMLRLGASFDDYYEMASGNFHLTGGVSWLTALENTAEASIFNIPVDISNSDDLVEGTLGMEYSLDGSSSMWLNVTHRSGINDLDTSNTSLALGLSMKF